MKRKIILLGTIIATGTMSLNAQTTEERARIVKETNVSYLEKLAKESEAKFTKEKKEAIEFARKNNIPVIINHKDGSKSELMKLIDGQPVYYSNSNVAAAKSTRANFLNPGGALGLNLSGENITANVWDGDGVRITHQEFGGRVTIGDTGNPNGNTDNNIHATHVAGTIAASGVVANAKGMAPKVTLKSFNWENDDAEITTEAAQGLLISNHSYGYRADLIKEKNLEWVFGAYIDKSASYDEILFNSPYYVVCKAAGNSGGSGYNTKPLGGGFTFVYDNLSDGATSKNAIVVANAQDANIAANGNLISVSINSSSSQGPTDDLRIKPDVTGNGTEVYSTVSASNTAYQSLTGTSMASPNVTGTLVLVNQHFKNVTGNYMLGAGLKGLALHTADDAGSAGPDASFGWGLLNAKKMAETINNRNTTALISDKSLANGATETVTINSDGVTPIIASISWYDRPGVQQTEASHLNSTTKRLVNNLDLRIVNSSNSTTYYPWALTSRSTNAKQDNNSDNFERVDAGVLPAGQYSVVISHKGTLTGGSQNYTLIVTGKLNDDLNAPVCTEATNLTTTNITTSAANISWTGSASTNTGYVVEYKSASESTWTVVSGGAATTRALSGLTASTSYSWRVKTNCSETLSSNYATGSFTTLAATTTPVSCAEAYEGNNTLATAHSVNLNTDYKAAIDKSTDVDYYKFTVPQGSYTVNLTNLGHDIDLKLQNASGSTLSTSQNSGTANEKITATLNAGTYYIRVYGYNSFNANSCYTLNVTNGNTVNSVFASDAGSFEPAKQFKVYPNPAKNEINVRLEAKGEKSLTLNVFDTSGKQVITQNVGDGINKVDISRIPAGIYILTVDGGKEKLTEKFIKQ